MYHYQIKKIMNGIIRLLVNVSAMLVILSSGALSETGNEKISAARPPVTKSIDANVTFPDHPIITGDNYSVEITLNDDLGNPIGNALISVKDPVSGTTGNIKSDATGLAVYSSTVPYSAKAGIYKIEFMVTAQAYGSLAISTKVIVMLNSFIVKVNPYSLSEVKRLDTVTFNFKVTGMHDKAVDSALIKIGNSITHTIDNELTDSAGNLAYSFEVPANTEEKEYDINFVISKTGFEDEGPITRRVKVSGITGIEDSNPGIFPEISLYPNPADGLINFNIRSPEHQKAELYIYDINGRQILARNNLTLETGFNNYSLGLENISPGQYIYLIKTGTGNMAGSFIVRK